MTPALTILAWAATEHAAAMYLTSRDRLKLERKPFSRVDRVELLMMRTLLPVIARYPGDRVRVRREVEANHPRWLFALDLALCLPEWWIGRAGALPDLVELWTTGKARGWQLPFGDEPQPLTVLTLVRDELEVAA